MIKSFTKKMSTMLLVSQISSFQFCLFVGLMINNVTFSKSCQNSSIGISVLDTINWVYHLVFFYNHDKLGALFISYHISQACGQKNGTLWLLPPNCQVYLSFPLCFVSPVIALSRSYPSHGCVIWVSVNFCWSSGLASQPPWLSNQATGWQ